MQQFELNEQGRRTQIITIDEDNRDNGKAFYLTEMFAAQTEKWAIRAGNAFVKGGGKLPRGWESNATVSISAEAQDKGLAIIEDILRTDFESLEPLLDEMWAMVKIKLSDAKQPRPLLANLSDIAEVGTIWKLRLALLNLHRFF